MCDFDEFVYTCGHSTFRLKSYCHRARNDPYKESHFVKKLRDVWYQSWPYPETVCGPGPEDDYEDQRRCLKNGLDPDVLRPKGSREEDRPLVYLQQAAPEDGLIRLAAVDKAQQAQQPSGQDPAQALVQAPAGASEQADTEMIG